VPASEYIDYRCDRCGQPVRVMVIAESSEPIRCEVPGCNGPLREIELEMDDR
jgi:DNA-directed RNA polymerase subunit RPC12/RpoP